MTKNEQLRLAAIKSIARDYVASYRGTSMDRELVAIEIAALDHGSPDCEDHTLFVELLPEWARQWYLHGETDLADRLGSGPTMMVDGDDWVDHPILGRMLTGDSAKRLFGIPLAANHECMHIDGLPFRRDAHGVWRDEIGREPYRFRPVDVLSPDPVPWDPPTIYLQLWAAALVIAGAAILVIWASGGRVTL